jgi:hypothetical protein
LPGVSRFVGAFMCNALILLHSLTVAASDYA